MNNTSTIAALLLLLRVPVGLAAELDFVSPCADRAAIERVYHEHRTGTKPLFEEAMPPALLERLVREDAKKEAVLARTYGETITDAMVTAEVERINTTTRAPEILAEIKAALGNDASRFARAFARPHVVERALRAHFENDDALHAPQRSLAGAARDGLLGSKDAAISARLALLKGFKDGHLQEEVIWKLIPRPAEDAPAQAAAPTGPTQAKASSGSYTVEATAQLAQVLSPPAADQDGMDKSFYFDDLPAELRNVLQAQLRQPGDVSAVIEMPVSFQLFLARNRTAEQLAAAVLTIPKRSYEEWLASQPDSP